MQGSRAKPYLAVYTKYYKFRKLRVRSLDEFKHLGWACFQESSQLQSKEQAMPPFLLPTLENYFLNSILTFVDCCEVTTSTFIALMSQSCVVAS